MTTALSELTSGNSGRIICTDQCETSCLLSSLGFLPECEVMVIRKSLFGGSIFVSINGQYYGLRKSEAQRITVEI